jgi:hypothetical protein
MIIISDGDDLFIFWGQEGGLPTGPAASDD